MKRRPSVMKHSFSQVPTADIPRSTFNRTHGYKTTFNSGTLIPFYVDEALPGDTFNLKTTAFSRLATPIVPVMDNMYMDTQYFAVPIRLVWENFKQMMGEEKTPGEEVERLVPQIVAPVGGFNTGEIEDYFGLPTKVAGISVSSLWHRAYALIWNEWYRDQNLQSPIDVRMDDGPDPYDAVKLQKRGKRHDYFTSALPWPQKGPGVELPLGTTAPVISNDATISFRPIDGETSSFLTFSNISAENAMGYDVGQTKGTRARFHPTVTGLQTDLSNATAATINSLRQAFQIQRLLERDARGGTRYIELLKSHFNVTNPDFRLQRPELLSTASMPIQINPVPQTTQTADGGTPQGNLAGYGMTDGTSGFTKSFTEHMLIMGIISVRADLTYQNGIPRMFSRRSRYDFYWPVLSHLGEQAILNKEIFAQGPSSPGVDDAVFGYQERWAEYRYYPSKITGKFRSNDAQPLDIWHLSQKFENLPVLNSQFIEENPPINRVIAVKSEPEFLFDSYIQCITARPMPTYSVPGMIDHF